MLIESTKFQQFKPPKRIGKGEHRWHVPWPDALSRAKRALADYDYSVADEQVMTTGNGEECVISLELKPTKHDPRNATICLGLVVSKPTYRGSYVYGGVVLGGVPAVLENYGSYKSGTWKGPEAWGITLDRCVARFAVDVENYRYKVEKLKGRKVPRLTADAVCYRMVERHYLTPSFLWQLIKLRPAVREETCWELIAALNAAVGLRPAICLNPRTTQLGGFLAGLEECKKHVKLW